MSLRAQPLTHNPLRTSLSIFVVAVSMSIVLLIQVIDYLKDSSLIYFYLDGCFFLVTDDLLCDAFAVFARLEFCQ